MKILRTFTTTVGRRLLSIQVIKMKVYLGRDFPHTCSSVLCPCLVNDEKNNTNTFMEAPCPYPLEFPDKDGDLVRCIGGRLNYSIQIILAEN